jgi:membrane protein DedA with SNARE-associated domain
MKIGIFTHIRWIENMPEEVVNYIIQYGYLAIFVLVFLQELGIPSPIPSELILLFSGYLSFKGILSLPLVILIAISSVITGTLIIYTIFYTSGAFLIRKKPKWFPVSDKMIKRLTEKISTGGHLSIYALRMVSITRGYSSVIVGLLRIKPRIFFPIALISGSLWVAVYVILGYILGPYWDIVIKNIDKFKFVLLGILLVIVLILIISKISKARKIKAKSTAGTDHE